MPTSNVPKHQRGKKKGRPPAHQNTFAYAHNPKSKKTDHILGLPNLHVCRRCHEKIEWRKKYRKYKPRTQPGKCNICQQRRVMAAYHTICESCTKSNKAKKIVHEHLNEGTTVSAPSQPQQQPQEANENEAETLENPVQEEEQPTGETTVSDNKNNATPILCKGRACAMCVKEFTVAQDDKDEEEDPLNSVKRLTLRQRKTLERQKEKKQNKKTNERQAEAEKSERDTDDDDENDPFLNAVGGANNLLTGAAYQQALLQNEQQA